MDFGVGAPQSYGRLFHWCKKEMIVMSCLGLVSIPLVYKRINIEVRDVSVVYKQIPQVNCRYRTFFGGKLIVVGCQQNGNTMAHCSAEHVSVIMYFGIWQLV
jgi:hypothetical protein